MYYAAGFYANRATAPAHAVAVSDDDYRELLAAQSAGKVIVPAADGRPLAADPAPSPYHIWDGTQWHINPENQTAWLAEVRAAAAERINAAVYAVQQPLLRFRAEYELREAQARAFAEADWTGEVPEQVAAFATPSGLTPEQAAQTILRQAALLHGVLAQLGVLRMRKFELQTLDDTAEIARRTEDILAAVAETAGRLQAG